MTTIYIPRLIESAEQAEALPIGTVAITANEDLAPEASVKTDSGWEPTGGYPEPIEPYPNTLVVGDYALVPIEAEEETREHPHRVEDDPESAYLRPVPQVRYKTPWEDA